MQMLDKHPKAQAVGRDILVGKDILELLSGAMYIEPLTFYREYIQNATDSIDEARKQKVLKDTQGRIDISIAPEARTIRIRDNGLGIPSNLFVKRLTAFGGSHKRGAGARGFRGVGRLSGLGYCQRLIMRAKSADEDNYSEMIWDCVKLKEELRCNNGPETLGEILEKVVIYRHLPDGDKSSHFFEIEMSGVVRVKGDSLLNPIAVHDYLGQVGPVPFDSNFKFGAEINEYLKKYSTESWYPIHINNSDLPITRPFSNEFEIFKSETDAFTNVEYVELPGLHDSIGAVGWILHHSYKGALPSALRFKGLRLRNGNIQVGRESICEELFPEPRFNSWTVGEFHVIDPKILPNGRRDAFEHNAHYSNLVGHLTLAAKTIAKRCRQMSANRAKAEAEKIRKTQNKLLEMLPLSKQRLVEEMEKRKMQKLLGVLSALSKCGFDEDDLEKLSAKVAKHLLET